MEFATDINNVMYAYIDRKKKFPVTTLLRAIGFESDKDILDIFGLYEEIKVSKSGLSSKSPNPFSQLATLNPSKGSISIFTVSR